MLLIPHGRIWSSRMAGLDQLKEDIVTANRILADNNVLDSFGRVRL